MICHSLHNRKERGIVMLNGEQQQKEIATIKGRTVTLNLSDADIKRLAEKSAFADLTVAQLLESFIGDLLNGTYSNGSDERRIANDWYDRCGYSYYARSYNFLQYLIENDYDIAELLRDYEMVLDFQREEAEGILDEDSINWKEDSAHWREVNDPFTEYKESEYAKKNSTLDEEMMIVMDWYNNLQKMLK